MRRACRVALQLRLSSMHSASVAGPSRSIVDQKQRRGTVPISISPQDEKLIQRGEFYGVAATSGRREEILRSPELALSRLHEHLSRNYRVNPESVMVDLVLRLENGDAELISLLRRAPDRWIPMAIRCCGRALSSIHIESRREIASRLWKQIEQRGFPISIESINARLRVQLDNGANWSTFDTLQEIEKKRKLVPNQETFHLFLEKISLHGKQVHFDKICDAATARGHSITDAISHSHRVYCTQVRMSDTDTDQLIQKASEFGPEGEVLNLGAACVAAASKSRIERLRELLRRSVDEDLKLRLSPESVFEIIWKLSERKEKGEFEKKRDAMIGEIMDRTTHPRGFFRFLYREIERHISASHFETAILLLEETMRVKDPLRNQDRNAYAEQLMGKMCRAMVRSKMETDKMMEMGNRMERALNIRSHDELMLATLTLKDYDSEDRFSAFSSLLAVVDPNKERPHLILPLLAITPVVDDRLKLLFRASSLGYSNLEMLEPSLVASYLLQPMYGHRRWLAGQRHGQSVRKDYIVEIATILHSYGIPKSSVWRMMNEWWKMKKEQERGSAMEMRVMPHAEEIQAWLRSEYSSIFNSRSKETTPLQPLTKTRLENAIEKGESSAVLSLLSTHGWPAEVDLASTAPRILRLLLENQTSTNIMKWLGGLSQEASDRLLRQESGEKGPKLPLNSSHMLKILRHRSEESRPPTSELIEVAYELKRLFPHAVFNQESFLDTISETNRLIASCFIFKDGSQLTMEVVDGISKLLSTLMKLEIVVLAKHAETVSPYCVLKVLQRFGWNSGVKLWLHFQSSFSFGNGMIPLIGYALKRNVNVKMAQWDIQFVTHKAHITLPSTRIHTLYAAALLNAEDPGRLEKEAVEYFEKHGSEMTPFDCALAYRLTNSLNKFPPTSPYFIRTFPALCLAHTSLAEKKDGEARNMLSAALRFCEAKKLPEMVVEMCDLFARYGVTAEQKEKTDVDESIEAHQRLVNRWIFSPEGFIRASADQEFIKEDEWRKFVKGNS